MMKLRITIVLTAIVLLLIASTTLCRADVSDEEVRSAFRWFDTLGYPAVDRLPFIRVKEYISILASDEKNAVRQRYGFLLAANQQEFRVFFPDLTEQSFRRNAENGAAPLLVRYEPADILQWGTRWVAASKRSDNGATDLHDGFDGIMDGGVQVFILARSCAARGNERLGLDLCKQALNAPGFRFDANSRTFRQQLIAPMAEGCLWRAILDCGLPEIRRETLRDEFQAIVKRFPGNTWAASAQNAVWVLEAMVREDRDHDSRQRKPLSALTGPERIKELIFQLRDQNGHQFAQPGECNIFADPREDKSPAALLVKMGVTVIPQLIPLLDDKRFTRSIGYTRNFFFSHHVVRIGDVALAIIEQITHRTFNAGSSRKDAVVLYGKPDRAKAEVQVWWAEYRKKGEQKVLVEAVSRGDQNSPTQAEVLAARYPQAPLPAIRRGLHNTSDSWVASHLVSATANLKGAGVTALLRDQLVHGAGLDVRLAAAWGLHGRGDRSAVARMIGEWRRFSGDGSAFMVDDQLVAFLASSRDLRGMQALGVRLRKRSVDLRLRVVTTLTEGGYRSRETMQDLRPVPNGKETRQDLLERAAEDVLAGELMDTEERDGYSQGGAVSFQDPRICDMAAYGLSSLWPKRYRFKSGGSLFERDVQRIRSYNIWRHARGKSVIPLPVRPKILPVPSSMMTRALKRVTTASSDSQRTRALAAIERLGLPALPGVLRALRTGKYAPPVKAGLESLAARLACIVRTVKFGPGLQRLDPDLHRTFSRIQGKPLTTGYLVDLLTRVTDRLRNGATGVRLLAYRDNDGTGFVLTLDVLPGKLGKPTSTISWSYNERVEAGSEKLYGADGGGSMAKESYPHVDFDEFARGVHKALVSPPLEIVSISVKRTRTE